jgi:DNA-binding protein HU-beta
VLYFNDLERFMNKAQFVELVQKHGDYKTKAEAEAAIKAFTDAVTDALVAKEDVTLVGFGSFTSALQKGKSGTVPGTDKSYTTADKMVPKFKAGKGLKDRVAEGK